MRVIVSFLVAALGVLLLTAAIAYVLYRDDR